MAAGWNVVWEIGLWVPRGFVPFCFQETAISLPFPPLSVFLGPVFSLLSNLARGKKPHPCPLSSPVWPSYILVDAANGHWVSRGQFSVTIL